MSLSCFYNRILRTFIHFSNKISHYHYLNKTCFRLLACSLAFCSLGITQNDVLASASSTTSSVKTIDDTEVTLTTQETEKQTIHKYCFPVDSFAELTAIADELIPGETGAIFPFLDCDETILTSIFLQSVGREAVKPLSFWASPDLFRTYEDNTKAAIKKIHESFMGTNISELSIFEQDFLKRAGLSNFDSYIGQLPGLESKALELLEGKLKDFNVRLCVNTQHNYVPLDQADLTLFSKTKWGYLESLCICSGLGFRLERGKAIKQAFSLDPDDVISLTLPTNEEHKEGEQYLCSAGKSKSRRILTNLEKRVKFTDLHDTSCDDGSSSSSQKRIATIVLVDNSPKVIGPFFKNFDPSSLPFDIIHVIAAQHNQYKAMASVESIIADYVLYIRNGEAQRLYELTAQDDDSNPCDSSTDPDDSNPDTNSDSGDEKQSVSRKTSQELSEQDIVDHDDSGDINQLFNSLSLTEKGDKKDSQSITPSDD